MNLKCELIVNSDVEHLQQIYVGFAMLHHKNFLNLHQTIPDEFRRNKNEANRWVDYKFFNAKVIVNDKITVVYDAHDWNRIDEKILSEADFYFKRSYDEKYVSTLAEKDKVFPFGLNYMVSNSTPDYFKVQRAKFYGGKQKLKTVIKELQKPDTFGKKAEAEQINNLEALPDFAVEPRIIFMARAWNPANLEDKKQKAAVEKINETRAGCVRLLRKEFGDGFFGGLEIDDYSSVKFKDCLLPDRNFSKKRKYLEHLKKFPICVATTGLNNSTGWKFAEYVALSKAIITEPLFFQVPGNFASEENYLEFTTPETLLEAATELFENKSLRQRIMTNNYRYYQSFLRPDSLILNTLSVVFQRADL